MSLNIRIDRFGPFTDLGNNVPRDLGAVTMTRMIISGNPVGAKGGSMFQVGTNLYDVSRGGEQKVVFDLKGSVVKILKFHGAVMSGTFEHEKPGRVLGRIDFMLGNNVVHAVDLRAIAPPASTDLRFEMPGGIHFSRFEMYLYNARAGSWSNLNGEWFECSSV